MSKYDDLKVFIEDDDDEIAQISIDPRLKYTLLVWSSALKISTQELHDRILKSAFNDEKFMTETFLRLSNGLTSEYRFSELCEIAEKFRKAEDVCDLNDILGDINIDL